MIFSLRLTADSLRPERERPFAVSCKLRYMKNRSKAKEAVWRIAVVIVAVSMVLGMVLPFLR